MRSDDLAAAILSHRARILRALRRNRHSYHDAEDALSTVLLRVAHRAEHDVHDVLAWTIRCATHVLIDRHRHGRAFDAPPQSRLADEDDLIDERQPEDALVAREDATTYRAHCARLDTAIRQLTAARRGALDTWMRGASPLDNVTKVNAFRARRQLRRALLVVDES